MAACIVLMLRQLLETPEDDDWAGRHYFGCRVQPVQCRGLLNWIRSETFFSLLNGLPSNAFYAAQASGTLFNCV